MFRRFITGLSIAFCVIPDLPTDRYLELSTPPVSIGLGLSVAPDKTIESLFNFLASAPAKIIADLSHISWATAIFLLLAVVSPALIAGLLVYKRLTGVLEGVVPLVQEKQAASANLIENCSSIPTYRPMVIVKEDTDLHVV